MLEVRELTVRHGAFTIVDGLSFHVREGEWLMIVGPNGAGKSTALGAVTQAVPYTGSVLLDGEDVKKMKPAQRARKMGVLMQKNFAGYAFTVEEVVRLGRYAYAPGVLSGHGAEDTEAVEEALSRRTIWIWSTRSRSLSWSVNGSGRPEGRSCQWYTICRWRRRSERGRCCSITEKQPPWGRSERCSARKSSTAYTIWTFPHGCGKCWDNGSKHGL